MSDLQPTRFDGQAADFDRRVGLTDDVCQAAAATVVTLAGARAGDRVLEIGAGPGLVTDWDFRGKQIRTLVNGNVVQDDTTTVIEPGYRGSVDRLGNILIEEA